jgi:hypothetical protein
MLGVTKMSSRRLLSLLLGVLLVVGLGFVSVPFVESLRQPRAAGGDLPRVELSRLAPGTFVWVPPRVEAPYASHTLVIRSADGQVRAFEVPTREGKYALPDLKWEHIGLLCEDFRPDSVDGALVPGGVIRCHDPGLSEESASRWRWSYEGKGLGQSLPDMQNVEYVREGAYLRFGA